MPYTIILALLLTHSIYNQDSQNNVTTLHCYCLELYIVLGSNGRNFEHLQQEHLNVSGLPLLLPITVHCNLHATNGGREETEHSNIILGNSAYLLLLAGTSAEPRHPSTMHRYTY